MKLKKLTAVLMSAVILLVATSWSMVAGAIVITETQYTYDSPNMSWLKGLIVKEDMNNLDGMTQRNTLVAKAEYPYSETADSFKEEVSYYQTLYTLDEDMASVIYLYMLEVAKSFASATDSNYSDEFIKSYLESIGIVYPEVENEETKIVARALFAIATNDENFSVKRGTELYDAFGQYLSPMLGVNADVLSGFSSNVSSTDLKDYAVAAARYMLFSAGYDVSKDTTEVEVFRLVAIMTIKSQGISIDSGTATFEEIKSKYLCAMICKIYDISIDTEGFDAAVANDELAFYILQMIGKQNGVTVKDSVTYKEAFDIVSKNTTHFNLEEGEFYADIYEYDVQLNNKREAIWIYAQPLGTTSESEGTKVNVLINDKDVKENYYVEVAIDNDAQKVPVIITVEYTDKDGSKTSSSYKINVIQGESESVQNSTVSDAFQDVTDIVNKVLGDLGLDSSIAEIVLRIPFELPSRILSIATLLIPNIDTSSLGFGFLSKLFGYSKDDDSNVNTDDIGGVGGLDAFDQSTDSSQSMDFGQLNLGDININMNNPSVPSTPADTVVIPDPQIQYPQDDSTGQEENWFEELISDTGTMIVLVIVLVASFGICLALFLKLLSDKDNKHRKNK